MNGRRGRPFLAEEQTTYGTPEPKQKDLGSKRIEDLSERPSIREKMRLRKDILEAGELKRMVGYFGI